MLWSLADRRTGSFRDRTGQEDVAVLALLFTVAPAAAQLPTPPVPGCQYAYGNLYGGVEGTQASESSGEAMKTYDGTQITSPEQLADYSKAAGDKTILIEGGNFRVGTSLAWNSPISVSSRVIFADRTGPGRRLQALVLSNRI